MTNQETTPILEVENVSLSFGGVRALDGVNMSVDSGSLFGLIGPNGAGKTSLVNCITRLYTPDAGSITFDGTDLLDHEPYDLAGLGILRTFQGGHLFDALTVEETCLLGAHSSMRVNPFLTGLKIGSGNRQEAEARDNVRAVLERLGLVRWRTTLASDLPFGLQKQVELARCLCANPKVLLLDEPASGLVHGEVDALADTLRSINETITIIVIEHNMRFIMGLCDRILVLHHGKTLAVGNAAEIHADPLVQDAYLGERKS